MNNSAPWLTSDVCLRFLGQFSTVQNLTDLLFKWFMYETVGKDSHDWFRTQNVYRQELTDKTRKKFPGHLAEKYRYSAQGFQNDYERLHDECRVLRDDIAHSEFLIHARNAEATDSLSILATSRYRLRSPNGSMFTVKEVFSRIEQCRWMEAHLFRLHHEAVGGMKGTPSSTEFGPPVPPEKFSDFPVWKRKYWSGED